MPALATSAGAVLFYGCDAASDLAKESDDVRLTTVSFCVRLRGLI